MLYAFQGGADGAYPEFGDLLFDRVGNIYGTTEEGGVMGCSYQAGCGTVYELSPSRSGWTESVLYAFTGPDGQYPSSGIILDNTGNLYGTTGQGGLYGGGTVFQLVHSTGWTESLLHSFGNGSDGSYLYAGLIFDQSGNLYGATSDGGENGGGTVFELSLSGDSWTYSLLYSFTGRRGYVCGPWGTLVMDAAGNFYGTTNCDGAYNAGSVFKLTNTGSGWTYTSLHGFTGGSDGGKPYSNVIFDTSGNIYGTALTGGSQCNCGVVWEITP